MKFSAILAVVMMLFINDSFAQRRPYPGPRRPGPGRPVPPPRRPVPPMPRPTPPRQPLVCVHADLYQYNWLIHRFRFVSDCHQGLQDLRFRGRFCDDGALFDSNGNFLYQYRNQYECRSRL